MNNKMIKCASLAVLLAFASTGARATLIDKGLTTEDDVTGLAWLDLTETAGLSAEDFLADTGGFISAGWSLANVTQVQDLLGNLFNPFPDDTGFVPPNPGPNQLAAVDMALSLFGQTSFISMDEPFGEAWALETLAVPGPVCQPFYQKRVSTGASRVGSFCMGASSATSFDELGVWAFRQVAPSPPDPTVPEPTTLLLLGIGLAGLGYAKRRLH